MTSKEAFQELYKPGYKFSFEVAHSFLELAYQDGVFENERVKVICCDNEPGNEKYEIIWK